MASYDGFGRVRTSSTNMGGVTRTLSYINDADGNRLRIDYPTVPGQAGVFFSYLFDGLDRPVFLFENGVVWHIIVPYTPEGPPSLHLLSNGGIRAFGYDALQRPSTFTHLFAASPAVTWTLARNAAGQIASIARDNDAYAWTRAHSATRPHATNGLNQYATTGQPGTDGSVAFTYDANGNLASETPWGFPTVGYTYDVENRLVGRSAATGDVTLSYDPLGRLYEVTGSSGATRFLYDGDALVAEYNAAGAMTRRYAHWFGADVPVVSYEGASLAQPIQLHADHQGSIVALSSASGAATINRYDEYGIPGAGNTGRFQYTGQIWLAELGMYHYKARVYSPTLGRFLQTDPIGYQDQVNLYAYAGNDPINGADPTGMFRFEYYGPAPIQERLRAAVENVRQSDEFFGERYRVMEESVKVIEIHPIDERHPSSGEIPNNREASGNGVGTGTQVYLPTETITLEGQGIGGQNITATVEDVVAHGVYSHGYDNITGTNPESIIDPLSGHSLATTPAESRAIGVENRYRRIKGEDQRVRHDSPVPWEH